MQEEPTGITTRDWIGWAISGAGVLVYFVTLIVIYVYTRETRKMQQAVTKQAEAANSQIVLLTDQIDVSHRQLAEMGEQSKIYRSQADELIHQTRLSFMPAFIAEKDWDGESASESYWDSGLRLILTNVGRGVALNLNVDSVKIALDNRPHEDPFQNRQIAFEPEAFVKPDQRVTLRHAPNSAETVQHLDPIGDWHAGDGILEVRVSFTDVEGNKYEQVIPIGDGVCWPGPVRLARHQDA